MNSAAPLTAIVIEDSRLAREGLIDMLGKYPEIKVVGQADHPEPAVELIEKLRPALLFLDIHMPGESGLELLARLDYEPLIIFTTAYSEYAIQSFEFKTVDYLLKPISDKNLQKAISRLENFRPTKERTHEGIQDSEALEEPEIEQEVMLPDHRLLVNNNQGCHIVTLSDIYCFESCKNYVNLFFSDQSAFIKRSLNLVEQRVPETLFFRCSRQHIINLKHIVKIEPWVNDGFVVTLSRGKEIEVSRRNATKLKSMLSL